MKWVPAERHALVETLHDTDPTADTLCAGWDVRRLLAHLVVRDQQLVAAIRDARAKEPPGQESELSRLVEPTSTAQGYRALVERFAAGPPRWSPMSWAGEQVNLMEYVIHHEDIRRAAPGGGEPRTLAPAMQEAIWRSVGFISRLVYRKAPVPVSLATPDGNVSVAKKGAGGVTVTGEPVELALYASGRRDQARVEVTGPGESVQPFVSWVEAA